MIWRMLKVFRNRNFFLQTCYCTTRKMPSACSRDPSDGLEFPIIKKFCDSAFLSHNIKGRRKKIDYGPSQLALNSGRTAEETSTTMRLILAVIVLILVVETSAQWYKFPGQAVRGTADMWRAYSDMKKANWKNSDKYFHARGNYDAARRGAGGAWAAKVISNGREWVQSKLGSHASDTAADQAANRWGRQGGDPNRYRPKGLPKKY